MLHEVPAAGRVVQAVTPGFAYAELFVVWDGANSGTARLCTALRGGLPIGRASDFAVTLS